MYPDYLKASVRIEGVSNQLSLITLHALCHLGERNVHIVKNIFRQTSRSQAKVRETRRRFCWMDWNRKGKVSLLSLDWHLKLT